MNGNVARNMCATLWRSKRPIQTLHSLLLSNAALKHCSILPRHITTLSWKGVPPSISCRTFASCGRLLHRIHPAHPSTHITFLQATERSPTRSLATTFKTRRKQFGSVLLSSEHLSPASLKLRNGVRARRHESTDARPQETLVKAGSRFDRAEMAENDDNDPKHGKGVAEDATSSMTPKHLMGRLPNISHIHRPTKEELLAAATGFWSRLKVRFKWASIRSARPFNSDEIGAFFSWVVLGHVLWIMLGTTTFFSLAIFAVNTVFAQETLARWVGNYLTKSSGIKVVFESAIVPRWGDGVITFKNVFVSRRPGQGGGKVTKGSPETAAAAAAATIMADAPRSPAGHSSDRTSPDHEDTNYTQFDVSIETVNVTLSFNKWFNSKGLLRDVEVKGVRGVIDRTQVHLSGEHIDPKSCRHEHNPGDFEIDSFKMEDLLVTVHQPNGFRPFSVSIFFCDLPQLRKQWLFYDFLSANTMSGSFDDSLFTIHPHQMHGHTGSQMLNDHGLKGSPNPWKKHSRLRIDGLRIDHLNRDVEGPFSWIREGNVDIIADVMFPAENDESIAKVMSNLYDQIEATVTSTRHLVSRENPNVINNHDGYGPLPQERPEAPPRNQQDDADKRFLIMDIKIYFNDVRAAVPLFTRDISYRKNALIRPIVAYINSRHTFIPIHCRVVKRMSDFNGSWTLFDSGLMDDLSAETYNAIAKNVTDDQARLRRFKTVGLWTLQLAVQALFMGMAGNLA